MAADLTYQEERQLMERLKESFGDWDRQDLELLGRAWLRMPAVKFAVLIHLEADRVAKQMAAGDATRERTGA